MKMFNIKYRYLFITTFCLTLMWSTCAHAGLISAAKEAWETVKEVTDLILGIFFPDNCPVPNFNENNVRCLFCGMFKAIFNSGSVVAGKAYTQFSTDLGHLLLVFVAVSLALIVLKNLSTMRGNDTASLMEEILNKVFICAAIYFIISGEYYPIINMTIVPLYETGLGLLDANGDCGFSEGIIGFSKNFINGGTETASGGMPVSLGKIIVCTIHQIESKINVLFDLGGWAFCRGFGPDKVFKLIPNLIHITDGLVYYACGAVLMVMFPWVLADATFQLVLSFALLPFAVCGYAFNGTKKFLPEIFSWIINSLLIFLFMQILFTCFEEYLKDIIGGAIERSAGDAHTLFTHPVRGLAFYGIGTVKIIFIVYLLYEYIPAIKELGDNFASGAGLSVGKDADTFMRGQVNKQGKKLGKKAVQGAKNTLEWGGKRVGGLARRGMTAYVAKHGSVRIPFSGKYNTRTVGGKQYLEKEKKYANGIVKERKLYDDYSIITIKYDRSGNEIGRHVEFRDSFAKGSLLDAKGRIDQDALKALMDSPLAQDPAYKQAIMEQIAINALEAKGKKVGKFYSKRTVTFNASNPNEILIDQVDHNGRVTKVSMKIDPTTGQVALAHGTKRVDNKLLRRQGVSTKHETSGQKRRRTRRENRIKNKLSGADHTDGLFYSYDKVVDTDGVEHYQKRLRNGWNVKNYTRAAKNVFGTVKDASLGLVGATIDLKLPIGIVSTAVLAVESVFSKSARRELKNKFSAMGTEMKKYGRKEAARYASDWHSGNVKDYSDKGYVKTDSVSGGVEKRRAADATVTTRADGSRQYVDNATGSIFAEEGLSGDFELFFTNGDIDFTTSGEMGKDGVLLSEESKFKYGAHIQKGHDSVISNVDGFQVIEKDGSVASDVDPSKLFFGLDNMLGQTTINGTATADFVKENIFVEGRKRKTNRTRTNYGQGMF